MDNKDMNNSLFDGLRKNWFIIVFIGGLILGWGQMQARNDAQDKAIEINTGKITRLEEANEKQDEAITKVSTEFGQAIVEIKANYLFIKEKLEKLDK